MFEINKTNATKINKGDFPLNHDCILKVNYAPGYLLRFQLLTCRSQDSGAIVLTLSSLSVVRNIEVISIDKFDL